MNTASDPSDYDEVLLPYLNAGDKHASHLALDRLMTSVAMPRVREIARSRIARSRAAVSSGSWGSRDPYNVEDVETVVGDVCYAIIARLEQLKQDPHSEPIGSFLGYVTVLTRNALNTRARSQSPARSLARYRLKYLLTRPGPPEFAIWRVGSDTLCGFRRWKLEGQGLAIATRYADTIGDTLDLAAVGLGPRDAGSQHPSELLCRLFEWVGGPMTFNDLARVYMTLTGVREVETTAIDDPAGNVAELADTYRLDDAVLSRDTLRRVWREIRRLPLDQRLALLLNLRDEGEMAIDLIVMTRIASYEELADALGMTKAELLHLFPSLPLDDTAIMERIGAKDRQKVINLRRQARLTLARLCPAFENE